jgi:hypothetical protein
MGACFCSGPRPGHDLCPCRERHESGDQRELRRLRAEVERLRRQQPPQAVREREADIDREHFERCERAGSPWGATPRSDRIRP